VKNVSLVNPSQGTKSLGVLLADGTFVQGPAVSDGLLRWLAYAAVPYLATVGIVLVEEPENGLHPAGIRDVMTLLREVSARVQVVISTHSPIVVDELDKHEVTVLRRESKTGTKATVLSDLALENGNSVRALDG
jgi:predicted ATPase